MRQAEGGRTPRVRKEEARGRSQDSAGAGDKGGVRRARGRGRQSRKRRTKREIVQEGRPGDSQAAVEEEEKAGRGHGIKR